MPMSVGATHFYVWYTVRGDLVAAVATIGALTAAIEERTGVAGRLLVRRDDPSTWMEIYENVTDERTFERVLAELTREHDALALTDDGKRHVERFASLTDALA
jgi:hypothetical protein